MMKKRMTPLTARYVQFGDILFDNMNSGNSFIVILEVRFFSKCSGCGNFGGYFLQEKKSIRFFPFRLPSFCHE